MENLPLILILIGVMWFAQLILTYKQAMKFNDSLKALRAQGESAVGMGGKRYRGGRAFVAIARQGDTVVDARVMTGWTVFAGPKPFPALIGLSLTELAGDGDISQLSRKVRSAAQMAASTLLKPKVTEVSE
jgi:DNA-binding transcriptional regulator of glucitol operon